MKELPIKAGHRQLFHLLKLFICSAHNGTNLNRRRAGTKEERHRGPNREQDFVSLDLCLCVWKG